MDGDPTESQITRERANTTRQELAEANGDQSLIHGSK